MKLEERLSKFKETVSDVGKGIKPGDDWMPTLIAEKDGSGSIYGFDGEFMRDEASKNALADQIEHIIKENKPDCVCFISAAWSLHFEGSDKLTMEMIQAGLIRPSTALSKRVEIVMLVVTDKEGRHITSMGKIKRSKDKHPEISEWTDMSETISGRFAEAIQRGFGLEVTTHDGGS